MSQNKAKEGIVSLPSGLQYKIIQTGTGAKPAKDDTVTVEYTGKLIDGQVFDSTEKTGKPATFKVSQVIPGWTEALQLMPAGSIWDVYVPAGLAYGPRSVGGPIGPNETLIFKIHLISVKKSDA
jgi:FKBP-type peptidyl-prolyl cis-trans isomerase FklB